MLNIYGINGLTKSLGCIETNIISNSQSFPIVFHVVNTLPSHIVGLLGSNFLKKHKAILNFENMDLTCDVVPKPTCLVIPARTEFITYIETSQTDTCVVLNETIQPNVYIANTIANPKDGKVPIRIANFQNKSVSIPQLHPTIKPATDFNILKINTAQHDSDHANQLIKELDLSHLHEDDKAVISKICVKYNDIFCLQNDQLSTTTVYEASLKIKNNTMPIYSKPYRLPYAQKEEVDNQIRKMLKNKTIEATQSEWNSPILLVPKKSSTDKKKWRLVIDYRKVNTILQDDKFPLPNIDEVIDTLSGSKYFSHLDLSQGYYQCKLRKKDRSITAFTTPTGQYQMTRLPMGLKISPSTFSRMMTVAMSGLNAEQCLVYLDDIVVFGKNMQEHNKHLMNVFERLRQVNLKLNPEKCHF